MKRNGGVHWSKLEQKPLKELRDSRAVVYKNKKKTPRNQVKHECTESYDQSDTLECLKWSQKAKKKKGGGYCEKLFSTKENVHF